MGCLCSCFAVRPPQLAWAWYVKACARSGDQALTQHNGWQLMSPLKPELNKQNALHEGHPPVPSLHKPATSSQQSGQQAKGATRSPSLPTYRSLPSGTLAVTGQTWTTPHTSSAGCQRMHTRRLGQRFGNQGEVGPVGHECEARRHVLDPLFVGSFRR